MNTHRAQRGEGSEVIEGCTGVRYNVTNIGDYQPYAASVVCVISQGYQRRKVTFGDFLRIVIYSCVQYLGRTL
jgi:hypothetical protein